MNELDQIFDTVNIGLVIMDRELKVKHWNRWMSQHSRIAAEEIVGTLITDHFPELSTPGFQRNCKAVLAFGNFSFFSQKLHRFLFPFKPVGSFGAKFEQMQQSCTMGPLRGEDNAITSIFIIVQDVTELATYEQKMMEMNVRDGLTGIYNRRHFENRLSSECERHERYDRRLSMIMIDIDFFKKVNDTYGHQCGDYVLKSVSSGIAQAIRKTDCLARYGGEEFCCLLPETEIANASLLAESLRTQVEGMQLVYDSTPIKVTISLGVSELAQGDSAQQLLKNADEALYRAKSDGRNRVVVADPSSCTPS